MAKDSLKIRPSDVTILKKLKESQFSVIFKVRLRGTICVMKVWPGHTPSKFDSPETRGGPFRMELKAYCRLKAKGFCERREIPDFYGAITNIQLALWPKLRDSIGYPTLKVFDKQKNPPNAIFIEYIPDCEQISLSNFSRQYLLELRRILTEIHLAGVLHHDPAPKNMMISRKQKRVFWMDFDRAQTCGKRISKRHQSWFENEDGLVDEFMEFLTQDHERGELKLAWSFYYDGMHPEHYAELQRDYRAQQEVGNTFPTTQPNNSSIAQVSPPPEISLKRKLREEDTEQEHAGQDSARDEETGRVEADQKDTTPEHVHKKRTVDKK